MTTPTFATPTTSRSEVELVVTGMTCGSCATRVQRVLAKRDGVDDAAVNFATAKATVRFDPDRVSLDDLVTATTKIGYGLALVDPEDDVDAAALEAKVQSMWLRRVLVAWPLGIVVLVLSLFYMDDPWARWGALALTTPVQFWAGLRSSGSSPPGCAAARPTWTRSSPWGRSPRSSTRHLLVSLARHEVHDQIKSWVEAVYCEQAPAAPGSRL